MSQKDFSKLMLENEEFLFRSAEYFIKKGRDYFTSNHIFCMMEEISPTKYPSETFQKDIRKRESKINSRYDMIINLASNYKNFY